jgi:hypothetical protein
MGKSIDTADTVVHRPSREVWLVAYVDGDHLVPCGWPLSRANLSDCDLAEKASAERRQQLLDRMAGMANQDDPRCRYAKSVLAAQEQANA